MYNLLDESILWTPESEMYGDESYERLNGQILTLKMDFDQDGYRIMLLIDPVTNSILLESSRVTSIHRDDPHIRIKTVVTELDLIRVDSLLPTNPTKNVDIIPYDHYDIAFSRPLNHLDHNDK